MRVEQSGLGTVFMCTHGGSRYGNTGCRRTYLSQRDLQAHINHRHVTPLTSDSKTSDAKGTVSNMQRKSSVSNESTIGNRPQQNIRSNQSIANVTSTGSTGRTNLICNTVQEAQQLITSTGLHHHQPPQTMAQDLSKF